MTVKLPGEIKIYNVGEVWTEISEIIEKPPASSGSENIIDAQDLSEIDGAGFQLMFMLFRHLTDDKDFFRLEGLKKDLAERFSSYGFVISGPGTGNNF